MELTQRILEAGIVGAGGAGFPTHVKLNTQAEWFIINAAECEPLIETDKYICRTFATELVQAAQWVGTHLNATHIVFALKGKYHQEIQALQEAIIAEKADITIFQMKTFYPAGDEQTMVSQVVGKSIPERGLPSAVGAVVNNVGTLLTIHHMMAQGKPVTQKYLSVVGEVSQPVMLHTPIGTPISQCIAAANPNISDYAIILGGPMMGKVVTDREAIAQAVVTKTTGNIIVLPPDHYLVTHNAMSMERLRKQAFSACIQCRMCTDLCPRYLIGHNIHPHLVMRNLYREKMIEDDETFLRTFGEAANCCSCGACELFTCPMGLSPRRVNDYIKEQLRTRGIDVPRKPDPTAHRDADLHQIPTGRLISRLGLSAYDGKHAHQCLRVEPEEIFIPFQQHIGAPAQPCCNIGDVVQEGDMVATAAPGLSTNIHAGLSGVVTEITKTGVRIRRQEG